MNFAIIGWDYFDHHCFLLFRSPLVVLSCLVLSIYLTPCGNEFRNSALVDMHTTMDHFVFVSSLCVSSAHLSVFLPACLPASQPTCLPAAFALCTCLGKLDAACLSGLCAGRRQNSKQQPQPGPAAGRMAPRRRLTARIAR